MGSDSGNTEPTVVKNGGYCSGENVQEAELKNMGISNIEDCAAACFS